MESRINFEQRITDLMGKMTLKEKISQLSYISPAIARLNIPSYNWWNECLHGVARAGRATVFPQPIALAATFDDKLVFEIADAIADEARAKHHVALRSGNRGQYRGLTFWSPNINIFRDPRWGRGHETYGEDPYLTAQMGVAFVKGLQGDHAKYLKVSACAKHFVAHSGPEKIRHSFDKQVTRKDLHETYLPAFKALVDAGVDAIMGAYDRTNGEPCCGSKTLLIDILREQWGFKGHVVSDCWAIQDFHSGHGLTTSPEESAALALNNGCDLNCGTCFECLEKAIETNLTDETTVDRALRNLLKTRFHLGMFDAPDLVLYSAIPEAVIDCAKHRQLAYQAAVESMVLLKNNHNLLPLRKDLRKLLVLGPQAAGLDPLLGNYYGLNPRMVTFLEGITGSVSERTALAYEPGCLTYAVNKNPINWISDLCDNYDAVIAIMGCDGRLEGEEGDALASAQTGDKVDINMLKHQVEFLRKIKNSGATVILVVTGGCPVVIPEDIADAIIFAWLPGEEGGNALANIIFGNVSPSGKLPVTFPRSTAQLPAYEDYSMQGRTYRYMTDPLYPFGFGLSYTEFSYTGIKVSKATIRDGETIDVSVTITNTGKVCGEEVMQMYIKKLLASVTIPQWSLKAFKRLSLLPGEARTITWQIASTMLTLINDAGESVLEPGEFEIIIGGSSPDPRSRQLGSPVPAKIKIVLV